MGPIGGGSALNLNTISRRLAVKRRQANKREKGKTASTSGARSTRLPRTATRTAEFSAATRPMAGALIASLILATLSSSVHVTTLRDANPSDRASRSRRWKRLRRSGSGRSVLRMSQSPRSDTWNLETYLRSQAGCLKPSLARKLAARPS